MDVPLWLGLFQHDHGVSLPEEGTGRTQLSQFDQLQHHLLREHRREFHRRPSRIASTQSQPRKRREENKFSSLSRSHSSHLLIEVYQGFIWELEGLDSLQDRIPVTAVNVRHEAFDAVHGVQRHRGLLLEGGQTPLEIIFLQILHDQTYDAVEEGKKKNQAS